MDPLLATILLWPVNFAPNGWAYCNGALLAISSNAALFSLLGTTYGGNGTTTFALPDFRGRVPVGAGTATSGTTYVLGQASGSENTSILISNLPAHNHTVTVTLSASNAQATASTPVAGTNVLAAPYDGTNFNAINGYVSTAPNVPLNMGATTTCSLTGNNIPINNMQPYLSVNYIIALQGIFPSRS